MYSTVKIVAALVGLLWAMTCVYAAGSTKHMITKKMQATKSPAQILALLQRGNRHYTRGKSYSFSSRAISRKASKVGQHPYAFIFSCIDSRSVPELVFNQPPGALFVSRIAGNVISTDVLGGMEFAAKYGGTKLFVVMGHTNCGAVAGACQGVDKPDQLNHLLAHIQPAVKTITHSNQEKCKSPEVINAIAKQNVLNQVKRIEEDSSSLRKMAQEHHIMLLGAMHNMTTGKVEFFDDSGKVL